ncbi:MAG TPA: flagellar hook-associated protein FlgL [Candidatus Solibacter sp.]|nr:flagellar hook-associated protein FlgL [Candidatus Solibacter sp.]
MSIRLNPNPLPNLLAAIQQSEQNANIATQQLSSGRRVNQLSDDPAAASSVVLNHAKSGQDDQFLQNNNTLQPRLQVADSSLSDVVTALTRALSLGTEGANGTLNGSDRQAIAVEVQGIQSQLVSLANASYQGTYLFGGTAVGAQPFTLDPSTGTVTYNGNTGVASTRISDGNSIQTNLPGSQLFQNASGNVFTAIQDLNTALQTNTNIGGAVTEIQSALSTISTQRVFYGNALNQITSSEDFLNQDKVNLSSQENSLIGADLATASSNLVRAQTAEQATLNAAGRTLSLPNLLSYLPPP